MTEEFIEKAKIIYGDMDFYIDVKYINNYTQIKLICKIHGEYLKTPKQYLKGNRCYKCLKNNNNLLLCKKFIEKAKSIHNNEYDYSKVEYKNNNTDIIIICKIHREFKQLPKCHLRGCGCPKCAIILNSNKNRLSNKNIIIKFIEKHGNKFNYQRVNYINIDTPVIIICESHGEFLQTPYQHLKSKFGCKKCSKHYIMSKNDFIKISENIHGDKYDYSKVDYIDSKTEVIIVCNIHGEFKQKPIYHYWNKCGCPKCSNNSFSKLSILWLDFLSKFHNIHIQHALNDSEYLIPTTKYKADGYCKETNTIYEFNGDFWHGNPKIYNQDKINKITNCTYKELYEKTLIKENKIKDLGYNLETIWENDWKKIINAVRTIQKKFIKYHY
jgi:hypothetical protein